jgi:hypothetical protein
MTVACKALHLALTTPGSLTLLVSPSLRQSQELFRKVVHAFAALGYLIPLESETKLAYELVNGSRLIALPGKEQTLRGYSDVNMLIIDEAARVRDEDFYAVTPMLMVSRGRLVALSTPYGKRGWWYQAWSSGEDWERIQVTAQECSRILPEDLERERHSLPRAVFEQEYGCVFGDAEDSVFASADLQACLVAPGSVIPWHARRAE